MRLFIAEKPSVGMDIARALGAEIARGDGFVKVADDVVTWCIGHLLGQAKPEAYGSQYVRWDPDQLPIVPAEWQMEPNPKTHNQLKVVQKLVAKADLVVNCGDSAREGQLIVDEILSFCHYRGPAKRLWLQEMNLPAIRKGLANMRDNRDYGNLFACALARARADWIMGMNLTRAYTAAWQSKGNNGTLHIGRVQTPTLCMIVARDLEIEHFQPTNFFVLRVEVTHHNGTFTATWLAPKEAPFLDSAGRVVDRKALDEVAQRVTRQTARIAAYDTKPASTSPPLPFSLGELQKTCNKLLGLSPSETLAIAQSLYERHKLTTYPRTDYAHLPEDEHKLAPSIIVAAQCNFGDTWPFPGTPDFTLKSTAWDSSKIGDHHGIRPTTVSGYDLGQLSPSELAIYRLIVRNFLAQFYPRYRYTATTVQVACDADMFRAAGTVESDPGWKVLFRNESETADAPQDEQQVLPPMAQGDTCAISGADVAARRTSAPPRFDGASIIDAMEKAHLFVTDARVKARLKETGIGTPATRAATVDNLIARDYINVAKEGRRKVYIATARGRLLYHAVPEQLRRPDLTAYFEELLGSIERGELDLSSFMDQQVRYVTKLIDDVKSGAVAAGMPRLEDCEPIARPTRGAREPASTTRRSPRRQLPPQHDHDAPTCPACSAPMRVRTGTNGPFLGCSRYPSCKHTERVRAGSEAA